MTLYMRKVLTSPQPSFSSMPLAALKYNKQEDFQSEDIYESWS